MNSDDLRKILETKSETVNLDYKETIDWNSAPKIEKIGIIKDILAFANVAGGGRIVFGVRDKDFEPIGLSQNCYDNFDVTKVNSLLIQYTDPIHRCNLYKIVLDEKLFVVIEIPEFTNEPIICKKDFNNGENRLVLKKGTIYLRTASAESKRIETSEDMRQLLNIALKNRSDDLLKNIRILLSGKNMSDSNLSYIQESLTYADDHISALIDDQLNKFGFMKLIIKPEYDLTRYFNSIPDLRNKLLRSIISYRGWDFPHIQRNREHGDSYNIDNGILSYTIFGRHVEAFCLFQNGLLVWKSGFWEDEDIQSPSDERKLSFISFIYHTMEMLYFINNFYDLDEEKININLGLKLEGCKGRRLASYNGGIWFSDDYVCRINSIEINDMIFNITESIANTEKYSSIIVKKVFSLFNFDIVDSTLQHWQDKFSNRQF